MDINLELARKFVKNHKYPPDPMFSGRATRNTCEYELGVLQALKKRVNPPTSGLSRSRFDLGYIETLNRLEWWRHDWFRGAYVFRVQSGFSFNEGGAGPIVVVEWDENPYVYLCFWTKWIAPRLYISWSRIELDCKP